MSKKFKKNAACLLLLLTVVNCKVLLAQITLTGQLRTRTEVRNGLGNLVPKGSKPSAFTSQRTRLNLGYKWDRVTIGMSLQDVRVWGQDASSISGADGNKLMLHEGWAELVLFNKLDSTIKTRGIDRMSIKIGRQELSYDDVRLLGNLDWLQQGRRHDMALMKTVHKGWQIDLGYAFNQNTDAFGITSTAYLPANVAPYVTNSLGILVPTPAGILPMAAAGSAGNASSKAGSPVWINAPNTNGGNQDYKSFTSVYMSKKIRQTKLSALFFNDNFGKYKMDSVGNPDAGYVYGKRFVKGSATDAFDYSGTHARYTYGLMINQSTANSGALGKIFFQLALYAQGGRNRDGIKMKKAYHLSAAATWQWSRISITPGYDILSGNDASTGEDEKFDPLYGTPHRHWGSMDYFYVGTGSPAGGLRNPYLKFKYTTEKVAAGIDFHMFSLDKQMTKTNGSLVGRHLGNELDLQINYTMNRCTNIELGCSMMHATGSMAFAKGQATTDAAAASFRNTANWTYLMLKFTPDFLYAKPVAAN